MTRTGTDACIISVNVFPCEFLGFRSGIVAVSVLLGCDVAASLGNWLPTFRDDLLVRPSRAAMYKKDQDISTVGHETTTFSRNTGDLLLSDAASHPKRREAHVFFVSFLCLFLVIFIYVYFLCLSYLCVERMSGHKSCKTRVQSSAAVDPMTTWMPVRPIWCRHCCKLELYCTWRSQNLYPMQQAVRS